jgi:hypothetical protein
MLNRLPSSGAFLPDSTSFGNLLGSSNRLNSLLSMNSLMGSREPSLMDIAALNSTLGGTAATLQAQLAAAAAAAAQQASSGGGGAASARGSS